MRPGHTGSPGTLWFDTPSPPSPLAPWSQPQIVGETQLLSWTILSTAFTRSHNSSKKQKQSRRRSTYRLLRLRKTIKTTTVRTRITTTKITMTTIHVFWLTTIHVFWLGEPAHTHTSPIHYTLSSQHTACWSNNAQSCHDMWCSHKICSDLTGKTLWATLRFTFSMAVV